MDSLGSILVAASQKGVCAIFLGGDPDLLARNLQNQFPKADIIGGDAEFEKLVAQVVGFVESPGIGLKLPLDLRGTAFQQRVWKELQRVPVGETISYSELANRIKLPKSVRAVARPAGPTPWLWLFLAIELCGLMEIFPVIAGALLARGNFWHWKSITHDN